ncbi:hypothetical protein [Streptomyces sp. NPDC053560]|uniref:hypothetical protein n=1 Tax=Streptomyces sp. NPDC053560 TaxID=3365711 RepID=UPI0037CD848B
MNSILGALGTVGLAVALTFLLILGTKGGGKIKPLGWGATLVLSMIAGAAYKAAGTPFDLVSSLVNDAISLTGDVLPRYSMPGMALTLLVVILWAKLSTRQVAVIGICFWYVASGADGAWGIVADKIQLIAVSLAS